MKKHKCEKCGTTKNIRDLGDKDYVCFQCYMELSLSIWKQLTPLNEEENHDDNQ